MTAAAGAAWTSRSLFLVLAAMLVGRQAARRACRAHRTAGGARRAASPASCSAGAFSASSRPREPPAEVVHVLAELGVLLLLFEIGLETDLREMFRVGTASLAVATVGVAVPFALGFAYWAYLPHAAALAGANRVTEAIFIGATLTATSVGITARVLSDLGRMSTQEARIIIGAAVIDDVLGLVILSVVSGMASGVAVSLLGIARTFAVAAGFLVVAVLAGRYLMPRVFDVVGPDAGALRARSSSPSPSRSACPPPPRIAGSALIIGAFAAGLILSGTNQFDTIEQEVKPVASIFTPIFFVSIGASVDLGLLDPTNPGRAGHARRRRGADRPRHRRARSRRDGPRPWMPFRRLVVGVGHGAARRGRAHLRRHRPAVRRARRGSLRCGAAHGHGDDLRGSARAQGAVRQRSQPERLDDGGHRGKGPHTGRRRRLAAGAGRSAGVHQRRLRPDPPGHVELLEAARREGSRARRRDQHRRLGPAPRQGRRAGPSRRRRPAPGVLAALRGGGLRRALRGRHPARAHPGARRPTCWSRAPTTRASASSAPTGSNRTAAGSSACRSFPDFSTSALVERLRAPS